MHSSAKSTKLSSTTLLLTCFPEYDPFLRKKLLSVLEFENKATCGESKNVFVQNSTKDRMTHFNISVVIKCRRDNDKSENGLPCKMRKIFKGNLLYCQKFPCGITLSNSHKKSEAVARRCSVKKMFLKILQNLQENTFIKKDTLAQVFSSEFCELFNSTFFYRTPPVIASEKFVIRKDAFFITLSQKSF